MLSKNEFELLVLLNDHKGKKISQRALADKLSLSLGTINKLIKKLNEKKLIEGVLINDKGKEALEPYRVKRAIFLAAGFGSRMVPITLNTPKPLVRVNGVRIIDTLLDAVVAAEIEEIIIVRGYLGEQFDQLNLKYKNLKFVDNPIYNEANNISSALCVKDFLQNAYVLESDLLLKNPKVIRKYEYKSNYLSVPVDRTDDWCLITDQNGIIIDEKIGGFNCHQMVGISYWDSKDGLNLKDDIEIVFNQPGGRERYWEQTAFVYMKEKYKVEVRSCNFEDIIEIDTFKELKKIDKTYDV